MRVASCYLYNNTKVVPSGRNKEQRPVWDRRILDFATRVGWEIRLCQTYRAQTKDKAGGGVKHTRRVRCRVPRQRTGSDRRRSRRIRW